MPKKRKGPFANVTSFTKGGNNSNRSCGQPSTELDEPHFRVRSNLVLGSSHSATSLIEDPIRDTSLRPRSHSVPPATTRSHLVPPTTTTEPVTTTSAAENWIVDQAKLLECFNGAMQEHAEYCQRIKGRNQGHTPVLNKLMDKRVGFGVIVRYCCRFRNCRFESRPYELFKRTVSGGAQMNLQTGIAMAKSDLTPTKVEFLSTVMNIKSPARSTLQKKYNQALRAAEPLAEMAMAENRKKVYESLGVKVEVGVGTIPEIEAATDGQYSNRSYHTPTGNSQSASIPVIENETGEGYLIQHSSLSKRDGSLDSHINHAESEAANINYVKTYQATEYPLALQTVTVDGDASIQKGFQKGVAECRESRLFQSRACSQHGINAAKRKFMREALKPLSNAQKQKLCPKNMSMEDVPEVTASNICPKCGGTFKNARGVALHGRQCRGSRPDVDGGIGLEPMFQRWSFFGNKVGLNEKKIIRNRIRIWLFSRLKREFYKGLSDLNPDKKKIEDDVEIKEKLVLAGRTVTKCITGIHSSCASDSHVCSGDLEPTSYTSLPLGRPLQNVPNSVINWISSIVDLMLSREALDASVVNGRCGTTSLVESAHHEIRKTVPKGFTHPKNETLLIKSGVWS